MFLYVQYSLPPTASLISPANCVRLLFHAGQVAHGEFTTYKTAAAQNDADNEQQDVKILSKVEQKLLSWEIILCRYLPFSYCPVQAYSVIFPRSARCFSAETACVKPFTLSMDIFVLSNRHGVVFKSIEWVNKRTY